MENLIIPGTRSTPFIDFKANGSLLIEGRSLPEDIEVFYRPVESWLGSLRSEKVVFNIRLEYFNSASSKKIFELFKLVENNHLIGEITINWHYEEGDEDCLESGEIFEELMQRANFSFYAFAEAAA